MVLRQLLWFRILAGLPKKRFIATELTLHVGVQWTNELKTCLTDTDTPLISDYVFLYITLISLTHTIYLSRSLYSNGNWPVYLSRSHYSNGNWSVYLYRSDYGNGNCMYDRKFIKVVKSCAVIMYSFYIKTTTYHLLENATQ
jgi:hypothetical protein